MNNVQFTDGPSMQGVWLNPKTGDSFKVRDTFFEDNNLIVMTADGRKLGFDQINDYVQSQNTDEELKAIKAAKNKKTGDLPVIPDIPELDIDDSPMVSGGELLDDEMSLIRGVRPNVNVPQSQQTQQRVVHSQQVDMINPVIKKLFSKIEDHQRPTIKVTVEWDKDKFPLDIYNMLTKYMDVSEDEVRKELMNNFVDMDDIRTEVQLELAQLIDTHTNDKVKVILDNSKDQSKLVEVVKTDLVVEKKDNKVILKKGNKKPISHTPPTPPASRIIKEGKLVDPPKTKRN